MFLYIEWPNMLATFLDDKLDTYKTLFAYAKNMDKCFFTFFSELLRCIWHKFIFHIF